MTSTPLLSVVVGLISGKKNDLARCLRALHQQTFTGPIEILVPYDDPCAEVTDLAATYPAVRFVRAAGLDTRAARRGLSREHHDTLRAIGIRQARGAFIALTEDHAYASSAWCSEMFGALERHPRAGAAGGAVECDSDALLNWAVWFCDFGRYQNPLADGPSPFLSDSNVVYRRDALERVEASWRESYHETGVHQALLSAGFELCTTPRTTVWQARGRLSFRTVVAERFVWGRSYAGTRGQLDGVPKRVVYAVLSPALPAVLTWRLARVAIERGQHVGQFVKALPLIVILHGVWAAGELVGYITGQP